MIFVAFPTTCVAAEPPVVWRTDYDAAKLQAAGEGKILFIQILTDS